MIKCSITFTQDRGGLSESEVLLNRTGTFEADNGIWLTPYKKSDNRNRTAKILKANSD